MTRNISQWMYTSSVASPQNTNSDEHHLLRQSYKCLLYNKRRNTTPNNLTENKREIRQSKCVSWAPDTSPILPNISGNNTARDYRRKVTRSWYGGQSCSGVSPAKSGPTVGPYGSITSTTVADTGILLSPTAQSQPLLSTTTNNTPSHKTNGIQIQKQIQNKQTQRPPPPSLLLNHQKQQPPQITVTSVGGTSPAHSPLPVKKKTARSRGIDFIMPGLRSFVKNRRTTSGSTTSLTGLSSDSYAKTATIVTDNLPGGLRKCETAITLSTASSKATLLAEPIPATNRLRVGNRTSDGLCSRCSSLLSLATSGSRYSLNTASATFVPVHPVLCKLCLSEVPHADMCTLQQCACSFCKHCMQAYINFEIVEGAYDISCPDAQCPTQGVITLEEIEKFVEPNLVEKHKKYRLNREVDIDKNRTWCPRAGCETVCTLCPNERCSPQSVHCPTCSTDFCSNCKQPWHGTASCEEQARLLGTETNLGIPFDSDLIKCCPMCNVPIEKDEGCAQMMCKRCKHVFCWYCLTSLDDDFLLRHYDKGPCKNKLGHTRASVIWHRTQVIGIFAGFGILLLVASPLLLLAAPCIVCCKCRMCNSNTKLENDDDTNDIQEDTTSAS